MVYNIKNYLHGNEVDKLRLIILTDAKATRNLNELPSENIENIENTPIFSKYPIFLVFSFENFIYLSIPGFNSYSMLDHHHHSRLNVHFSMLAWVGRVPHSVECYGVLEQILVAGCPS